MAIHEYFAGEDFSAVLPLANQAVWWVPAVPCSCLGDYHHDPIRSLTPDPECQRHDEDGFQYLAATWITGSVMQAMEQSLAYDQSSAVIRGRATLLLYPRQLDGTPNPAYPAISDHDLIIAPEAPATLTDAIPIGQRWLPRPALDVIRITVGDTVADPATYTLVDGAIQWGPSWRAWTREFANVTYRYAPVYTLLTSMPIMRVFADLEWPRSVRLEERVQMGFQLLQALGGKVPGWPVVT